MKKQIKSELCNHLIKEGLVVPYQVIRHSYSTYRLFESWEEKEKIVNLAPTLDTRCDCLGVVIYEIKNNTHRQS